MRKLLAATALAGVLVFAGCETTTVNKKLTKDVYWVCDTGDDSEAKTLVCGANPEKGLKQTCFAEGRSIAAIRRMPDDSILVTCGERLR